MGAATSASQQQQQAKSRNLVPNQVASPTATRFPPALTPISGANNVIQAAANSTSMSNMPANVNSIMAANNRQQQQRMNLIQSGGEIIDLSSPPHSPQRGNDAASRIPSAACSNYNLMGGGHPSLPPLKRLSDSPLVMKNGVPQYKVSLPCI